MKFSSTSLIALAALPLLFAKEAVVLKQEPSAGEMTITQKLFSLGLEFQPDADALLDEKLPTIEKLLEAHLNMKDDHVIAVGKNNERLKEITKSYNELKESVEGSEHLENLKVKHMTLDKKTDAFEYRAFVDEKMPLVEEALMEAVHSNQVETEILEESAVYTLTTGGKRLRPMLCLAAFEAVAGSEKDSSVAIPTAVSAELIHSMSLMTDDLPSNDNDEMRRGVPSNHVVYGENVAMLAAGSMVGYAFSQVLEETEGVEAKVLVQVASRLAKVIGAEGMAGGQLMDLLAEDKSESEREFSLVDLEWIHLHKTASLIQYAVVAGGILGGASSEEIDAMEVYGHKIGLAFQVVDDLLDMEQDEAVGKLTYPKLLGEEGARIEAAKLIAEAKDALEVFDKENAKILYAFADFLTERANE